MAEKIKIHTEFIRLCDLLKFIGAAETGGMAKEAILGGEVAVNGEVCFLKGKKLRPGDKIEFGNEEIIIE